MSQYTNTVGPALMTGLLSLLMVLAASPLKANNASPVPVNIYGDGNPFNGVEDSREPFIPEVGKGGNPGDRHMSAGTISCDGKFRGTAMVVDTRDMAPDLQGVLLVSAAHVLYDLEKNRLFRRCRFNFMGWEGDAAYRSKIDLKEVLMGDFDPMQSTGESGFGEGDWAFLYLRKPWKKFNPDQSLPLREFSFAQMELYRQSAGEFRLLAFDADAGTISESRNCMVVESEGDDIGGSAWRGQLLDDCDSGNGASGGGIVAVINQEYYLIGIRNGSHWSKKVYPADRFPLGPPDGSIWNRRLNSNFGRAIDAHLLHKIGVFIQILRQKYIL